MVKLIYLSLKIESVLFTLVFAGAASYLIISLIRAFMPIRVSQQEEALGLDKIEHDENAYPTFMGMDS